MKVNFHLFRLKKQEPGEFSGFLFWIYIRSETRKRKNENSPTPFLSKINRKKLESALIYSQFNIAEK